MYGITLEHSGLLLGHSSSHTYVNHTMQMQVCATIVITSALIIQSVPVVRKPKSQQQTVVIREETTSPGFSFANRGIGSWHR